MQNEDSSLLDRLLKKYSFTKQHYNFDQYFNFYTHRNKITRAIHKNRYFDLDFSINPNVASAIRQWDF
ncbi:hypothetical protein LBMAG26_13300 [Bacteroidota bacterium]|nr:hypothetical protein LBMAG26_13300 [Bacteroidota bacterium]